MKLRDFSRGRRCLPGRNVLVILIWEMVSAVFFKSFIPFPYLIKRALLRMFGASIGRGFVIKQHVTIKYPWKLGIGDYVWVGERVWLDNLDNINIGSNVCISQGALLITGNHNYKKDTFDLITGPIYVEDEVWIGAGAIVGPGVTVKKGTVVSLGTVVTKDTEEGQIYSGNPSKIIRTRY